MSLDEIPGSIVMTQEDALETLSRSARHWLKELSNLTKLIDDQEFVDLYLE